MYRLIAEDDLFCSECLHEIPFGAPCLSQVPVEIPMGFHRRSYDSFCVDCVTCRIKGRKEPCFAWWLARPYAPRKVAGDGVRCGYCSAAIPEGTRTAAQKFYVWVDADDVDDGPDQTCAHKGGPHAGGPTVGATASMPTASGWESLSFRTRLHFQKAGLGGHRGFRTAAEAQRFFERSVPQQVRNGGDRAVQDFLRGKDASHIKSVHNAPRLAKEPGNVIWEKASKNRTRGAENMSKADRLMAGADNLKSRLRAGVKAAPRSAAKGGLFALAMEAPVSGAVNLLHWKRGRKTGRTAAMDAAKDTAVATVIGGGAAAALTVLPLSMGPLGVPVAVAGGALWVYGSASRIAKAARHDLPLAEMQVFFCKDGDCGSRFVEAVSTSDSGDLV